MTVRLKLDEGDPVYQQFQKYREVFESWTDEEILRMMLAEGMLSRENLADAHILEEAAT